MKSSKWWTIILMLMVGSASCSDKNVGDSGLDSGTPKNGDPTTNAETSVAAAAKVESQSDDSATVAKLIADIANLRRRVASENYDIEVLAKSLGPDFRSFFTFVRDKIRYEAYSGVLREADGALAANAGNAFDRSLLLSDLLNSADVPTRFVACDLPRDRGEELYRHIFDGFEPTDPVEWPDEPSGFLARVVKRAQRDIAVIRSALGDRVAVGSDAREQAIKDASRHAWVQARVNGEWLDLDTAFPDSQPGRKYCAAQEIVDSMPNEWHQQLAVRVMVERVEDGAVTLKPYLNVTMPAAELIGKAVFLVHIPAGSQGSGLGLGAQAAASPGRWSPMLVVGDDVKVGQPINFGEDSELGFADAFGGFTSTLSIVSEWIEIEVMRPDGRKDSTRRVLFDRANAAWRTASTPDPDHLLPLAKNDSGPLATQAVHNLLFSGGALNLAAFADAVELVVKFGGQGSEIPAADVLYSFAVRNFTTFVWTDNVIVPVINSLGHVRLYNDSPRVLIVSAIDAGYGVSEVYDLRRDYLHGLADDVSSEALIFERKLWYAALEGALEHETVVLDTASNWDDPPDVLSTSSLLGRGGVLLLSSADADHVKTLTADPDKAFRLSSSLHGGTVVVVPKSSLQDLPLGFWEIRPNGDSRAVLVADLNGSFNQPARGTYNPIPRSPQTRSGSYTPRDPPSRRPVRGKIEQSARSRAGDEYLMVLSISQGVVVGVTELGVILHGYQMKKAKEEFDAWQAAADQKQRDAMRAAKGGP